MIVVYSKIAGKMAAWEIDTDDHTDAISQVKAEVGPLHKRPILCLFTKPVERLRA